VVVRGDLGRFLSTVNECKDLILLFNLLASLYEYNVTSLVLNRSIVCLQVVNELECEVVNSSAFNDDVSAEDVYVLSRNSKENLTLSVDDCGTVNGITLNISAEILSGRSV